MTATTGPRRLPGGGRIDRRRELAFSFDGRAYRGFNGDTLASALLAAGVRLFGRSFKYHRPRGLLSAGPEEPNALVELRTGARREPNTRATEVELYDGLAAQSQNRWPSLAFDLRAVHGWFSPLLAAWFYYTTFMWPASFWERVYEPLIRRAAGLSRASGLADPDAYEKVTLHCDVLVIGAGPAGLAAALAGGGRGARGSLRAGLRARGQASVGTDAHRRRGGNGLDRPCRGRTRLDAGGDDPHAHDRLRGLRPRHVRRDRTRRRPSRRAASLRAAATAVARHRSVKRSRDRGDRASPRLRRQ